MENSEPSENSRSANPVLERILDSLKSYYNINYFSGEPFLVARCDYFEKSERFMVSKKANLWTANCEEFLYLFFVKNLSAEIYGNCMERVAGDWEKAAHIGSDHMYTYVTPVFVCDSYEEAALKKLRRCRIYKTFKFSFHGWMEYHTALVCGKRIFSNGRGRGVKKMLEKVVLRTS